MYFFPTWNVLKYIIRSINIYWVPIICLTVLSSESIMVDKTDCLKLKFYWATLNKYTQKYCGERVTGKASLVEQKTFF